MLANRLICIFERHGRICFETSYWTFNFSSIWKFVLYIFGNNTLRPTIIRRWCNIHLLRSCFRTYVMFCAAPFWPSIDSSVSSRYHYGTCLFHATMYWVLVWGYLLNNHSLSRYSACLTHLMKKYHKLSI